MPLSRIPLLGLVALLALAGIAIVAFRGFITGDVIRWSDAYVALEAAETSLPGNPAERERLLLANAMVDGEPPPGMTVGRRVHAPGALLRLRYEVLSESGEVTDTVEVRTIAPRLPAFGVDAPGAPFGHTNCSPACQKQLPAIAGTVIQRSGQPGLAEEWVMRMPAGATFDLGKVSFTVQDFQDDKPFSIPYSRMRVTLLEACNGRLRAGATTNLEFFPFAPIPIPSGFRTSRWVQLEGCQDMASRPPPPRVVTPPTEIAGEEGPVHDGPEAPVGIRSSVTYPAGALEAIIVDHTLPLGEASLKIDERWLAGHGRSMRVRFHRACRYSAQTNSWTRIPHETEELELAYPPAITPGNVSPTRVALKLPEGPALFWVEWTEADLDPQDQGRKHAVLIQAGRVTYCRYGGLPAAAQGEIVVCVPQSGGAEARVVPDPGQQCGR